MSRHYLHGNVHECYSTILNQMPKSWTEQIPESTEWLREYDVDGDPQHHSMLCLHTPDGVRLLRSVCVRKHNALSPSYYVHKQGFSFTTKQLLHEFEKFLRIPFYTEAEFDRIAAGESDVPRTLRWIGDAVSIDGAVLRSVLRGMVSCWCFGSDPVVVAVPEDVDYNSYCYGAVSQIYSRLPVGIRAQAGFMTYTRDKEIPDTVALLFVPARKAANAVWLDAPNSVSIALAETFLPQSLSDMLDHLAADDDSAKRMDYLQRISDYVETDPMNGELMPKLNSNHYMTYLEHSDMLDPVDSQEKFDRQLKFFKTPGSMSNRMQEQFLNSLDIRVTAADLDRYALDAREGDKDFPTYAERIAELEPMVRHSKKLRSQVEKKLKESFLAGLDQCDTLQALETLYAQLSTLGQKQNPFLNEQTLKDYRGLIKDKRGGFHRTLAREYTAAASKCFEKLGKQDIPGMDGQLYRITEELKKKLAGLEVDTADDLKSYQAKLDDYRTERILTELASQTGTALTKETYEKELKRLETLRDYLRGLPKGGDPLKKDADEAIENLKQRYQRSGLEAESQYRAAIGQQCGYFQLMEDIQRVLLSNPERLAGKEKEARKVLTGHRPATWEVYSKEYQARYKRPLTVAEPIHLGKFAGNQVLDDMTYFAQQELCVSVNQKMICTILMEITRAAAKVEMLGGKADEVWLTDGKMMQPYPRAQLERTLQDFQCSCENQLPLNGQQLKCLIDQLAFADLVNEDRERILDSLLAWRCEEQLVDACLKKIVEWPCPQNEWLGKQIWIKIHQKENKAYVHLVEYSAPVYLLDGVSGKVHGQQRGHQIKKAKSFIDEYSDTEDEMENNNHQVTITDAGQDQGDTEGGWCDWFRLDNLVGQIIIVVTLVLIVSTVIFTLGGRDTDPILPSSTSGHNEVTEEITETTVTESSTTSDTIDSSESEPAETVPTNSSEPPTESETFETKPTVPDVTEGIDQPIYSVT